MLEDSQIIAEVLNGDPAAFEQLVRKHQDRLFNTIFHLIRDREEAEDVVQEALVKSYVKLSTFQGQSAFYTWLYRIAFNIALGKQRRKRTTTSVDEAREVRGLEPIDDGERPGDRMEQAEQAQEVRRALDALNEQHRAILVLREMEGCCYEVISEVLDLPIGTVRSRLHRARIQLRQELEQGMRERLSE